MCLESKKLIIEVNGPYHFNPQGNLNLYSRLKTKKLEGYGYRVINLDYKEMNNTIYRDVLIEKINEISLISTEEMREVTGASIGKLNPRKINDKSKLKEFHQEVSKAANEYYKEHHNEVKKIYDASQHTQDDKDIRDSSTKFIKEAEKKIYDKVYKELELSYFNASDQEDLEDSQLDSNPIITVLGKRNFGETSEKAMPPNKILASSQEITKFSCFSSDVHIFELDFPGMGGKSLIGNELPKYHFLTHNILAKLLDISIPPLKLFITLPVHEDLSTESTCESPTEVEFQKRSNNDFNQKTMIGHYLGYLAAQLLIPGITCIKDTIDGNNDYYSCYAYYKNSFILSQILKQTVVSAVSSTVFGITFYNGANTVNSIIAGKLAADTTLSIIEADFNFDTQSYAKQMLQYLVKTGAAFTMSSSLKTDSDIANTILINIAPALIDFSFSLAYRASVIVDDILNPNGDHVDFDYYFDW